MTNTFDEWNVYKKKLDTKTVKFNFRERELWWCSLGHNLGSEQNGTGDEFDRPVLIVRKFNKALFWSAALTSIAPKSRAARFYKQISYDGQPKDIDSYVILSQLRVLSAKRLIRREGRLSEADFEEVIKAISKLLPL